MGKGRNKKWDEKNGFGDWGDYFEAKKAKLTEQYEKRTVGSIKKLSDIFNGISIFVNGLTNPNSVELKELMAAHGGTYHTYQTSSTTHIIASNLPNVKINKLGSVPIVKPSWITDSISLGKLLDYRRYLLYTNQTTTQPKLDFSIVKTKTASDPEFLQEFYKNSRLHLISTLRDEFKQYVADLREKKDNIFPGREKLIKIGKTNENVQINGNIIMHIDMDCFFVSVGIRNRPELKNQPVAVTHARNPRINHERDKNTLKNVEYHTKNNIDSNASMSEIASCSYEARKCGVKNGMFLGTAIKLCPNLKTIPYDFDGYKEVSHILYQTIASYTLDIEAVSCDEMYVNVTDILRESSMSVEELATHLRNDVISKTGCPCSAGFGANRLQARLATKRAKPCGQYYLKSHNVESHFASIPLSDLPGVGYSTLTKLNELKLINCGDVQIFNLEQLKKELGQKTGQLIYNMAYGIDRKELNYNYERKSISAEINYGIRFVNLNEFYKFLESLSKEVFNRLNDVKMMAKCLTLKLMIRAADAPVETAKYLGHGLCDSFSKSIPLNGINDFETIFKYSKELYGKFNVKFQDLRGIGLHLSKLEKISQTNTILKRFLNNKQSTTVRDENKEDIVKTEKFPKNKETLNDFFKVARSSGSQRTQQKMLKLQNIDLNVLNELPEPLRQEILNEYKINIKIDVPEDNGKVENKTPSSKCDLNNLEWPQIKEMITAWIQSEKEPTKADITMLGEYLRELAINREIERLKSIFNFLHRKMSSLPCNWHRAYYSIINTTQEGMVARYGAVLKVQRHFDCCQFT